jgi:hypothetical protein
LPSLRETSTEFNVKLSEFSNESLITVNSTLNPKLWEKGVLKPEIAAKLKEIAKAFIEFVRVGLDIEDVTVTGSNANFTLSLIHI